MRADGRIFLCAAFLVAGPIAIHGHTALMDLDIRVPMGTPLDWEKELHQPIPTSHSAANRNAPAPKPEPGQRGTGVVTPGRVSPPPIGYTTVNLYNFLKITTIDITTHFKPKAPETNPAPIKPPPPEPPTISTGSSAAGAGGVKPGNAEARSAAVSSGIESSYPPKIPGELFWIAIANLLRAMLHPEVMSEPETMAYLVELGEPSMFGAEHVQHPWANRVRQLVTGFSSNPPEFPKGDNPVENVMIKLAVLELCSGFPHALDPRYAKRILLLGEMAYPAVVKCANSSHLFLSRNAATVLANYANESSSKDLARLLEKTKDPVIQVRAIMGIGRRRDRTMIPLLKKYSERSEDYLRAAALYALGNVAYKNKEVAVELCRKAKGLSDPNLLWSYLPALARIADNSEEVQKTLREINEKCWASAKSIAPAPSGPPQGGGGQPGGAGGQFVPPNPEPAGYKNRIVADMALIALAASGDVAAQQEVIAKIQSKSGTPEAFTEQSWLLLCEVLASMGDKGLEMAKTLADYKEVNVGVAAVRGMRRAANPDVQWLFDRAVGGGNAQVRASALASLFSVDELKVREAAKKIVAAAGIGTAEEAYLTAMAVQMLDYFNCNEGAPLLALVEKANAANAVAKRVTNDEYDVTRANFEVFPPLLEICTLALGKTRHAPAIPKLVAMVKESQARAEAALALGGLPTTSEEVKTVCEALLDGITNKEDGWLRFCCYLALKNISGKDFFVDYIFGENKVVWSGHDAYAAWLEKFLAGDPAARPAHIQPGQPAPPANGENK